MTCGTCDELEISLAFARKPASPEFLQGLTLISERKWQHEAGIRIARAIMLLQQHKAQCIYLSASVA